MDSTISTSSAGDEVLLLADEVFHHIGGQIVDGTLAPGQRIRDINLATSLHVSRTPVREALQRLERLGLVNMYPSRYTEVTTVTPEIVAQTREFAGYQAGIAARMAVPRLTQHEREHLATLVDDMYPSLDDGGQVSASRWVVFLYLSDRSGNAQHRMLITDSRLAVFRNLRDWTVPEDDRERMLQIYRDFRAAILDGDAAEAERLARAMHYV